MPATVKTKTRQSPYDRPEGASSDNAPDAADASNDANNAQETPEQEQARLLAAIKEAAPAKPKTQNYLDFRTLTPAVLKECLHMNEPKQHDTCLMAFCRFDLKRYAELTGIPFASLDLKKYGSGNMCVLTPFARMPFAISHNYTDERTGKPKYQLTFSLYNPDCQQDLDDFEAWVEGAYKNAMLDLIEKELAKWGEKPNPNQMVQRAILESMWHSAVKASADPQYKNNFTVKIKNMQADDAPILQVWNQKTQGSVTYNQVQQGDFGSAFTFFEGVTKVGGKFYPRVFTRAMIYCDPITRQDLAAPLDTSYPLGAEAAMVG